MSACSVILSIIVAALGSLGIQTAPRSAAPVAKVTLPASATSLIALPGSSRVAAGLTDGHVAIWNGRDPAPEVLSKPHAAQVLAVAVTPEGRDLWSIAADGSLSRTPLGPGGSPASLRLDVAQTRPRAAAFSSDCAQVVTGGERGEILVFDTASGVRKLRFQGHRTELHFLALRPGSSTLASASAEADLRTWDTTSGRAIASVDGELALFALSFSPRDGTLAVGGVDRRLTLRDPVTLKPRGALSLRAPKMVATLAWSPDGRQIAMGDLDDETLSKGGLQIVDAQNRGTVTDLDTGGAPAAAVVFTAEGSSIVAIVSRELRSWTLRRR